MRYIGAYRYPAVATAMMKMLKLLLAATGVIALASAAQAAELRCPSNFPSAAAGSSDPVERNKALVKSLFDIIYGTSLDQIGRINDLVAEDYIQHNPRVEQGREGLRKLLVQIVPEPKELKPADCRSITFIAEGDYVVRQEVRANGMLVDIFRVKDGKLQEHWDAFRFAPDARRIPGF